MYFIAEALLWFISIHFLTQHRFVVALVKNHPKFWGYLISGPSYGKKTMKKLILMLILTFPILIGYGQETGKNFIDQNYIEVMGKAEMDLTPDMIYLKIVLSDKDNKYKMSLDEVEKLMIGKLTEIGIDLTKDLSISDFTSKFKYYWISKSDIVLSKEYQLILHDAKNLQKVFVEFQKLGISNVSIEKLDHTKIIQYRKEVKINAIQAAKDKAESLTSSINQTIEKAIYIQEVDLNTNLYNTLQGHSAGLNIQARGVSSSYLHDYESSMPEIEFEKINLQYSILVRFELK